MARPPIRRRSSHAQLGGGVGDAGVKHHMTSVTTDEQYYYCNVMFCEHQTYANFSSANDFAKIRPIYWNLYDIMLPYCKS